MTINFVNADHVHALIDLPTGLSIEKVVQLLKGSSSHWVNSSELVKGKIRLGQRLRCILRIGVKCESGSGIYRKARRTSS